METEGESFIPDTGAVFTFGVSNFADNTASHFYIRNDPIVDIACGEEHTMVICQNGRLFGFGGNEYGQVGLGHTNVVSKPSCIKVLKPDKVKLLTCGRYHTLVYTESGKLYCWGNNTDGQLGLGENYDSASENTSPMLADEDSLFKTNIIQLSAGLSHSVALTYGGNVYVWGSNEEGQLGLGEGTKKVKTPTLLNIKDVIIQIACGFRHTALLTDKRVLFVFGEGKSGKLGLGGSNSVPFPIPVAFDALTSSLVSVAAGGQHTVALTDDGVVYAWGDNGQEQLGMPVAEYQEVSKPIEVSSFSSVKIRKIFCGDKCTTLISDKEKLYLCGDDGHGQLYEESNASVTVTPFEVEKVTGLKIKKVACGSKHTIILATLDSRKFIPDGDHSRSNSVGDRNSTLSNLEVSSDNRDIMSPPPKSGRSSPSNKSLKIVLPDNFDVQNKKKNLVSNSSDIPSNDPSPSPNNISSSNDFLKQAHESYDPLNTGDDDSKQHDLNNHANDTSSENTSFTYSKTEDGVSIINATYDIDNTSRRINYEIDLTRKQFLSYEHEIRSDTGQDMEDNLVIVIHSTSTGSSSNKSFLERSSPHLSPKLQEPEETVENTLPRNADDEPVFPNCSNFVDDEINDIKNPFNHAYKSNSNISGHCGRENSGKSNSRMSKESYFKNNQQQMCANFENSGCTCSKNDACNKDDYNEDELNSSCDQKCDSRCIDCRDCECEKEFNDGCNCTQHDYEFSNLKFQCVNEQIECELTPKLFCWYKFLSPNTFCSEECQRQCHVTFVNTREPNLYEEEAKEKREIIERWIQENRLKGKIVYDNLEDLRNQRFNLSSRKSPRNDKCANGGIIIGDGDGSHRGIAGLFSSIRGGVLSPLKNLSSKKTRSDGEHDDSIDRSHESLSSNNRLQRTPPKEVKSDSMMNRIFGTKGSKKNNVHQSESSTDTEHLMENNNKNGEDQKEKRKDYRTNNGVPPNRSKSRNHQKNSKMCLLL